MAFGFWMIALTSRLSEKNPILRSSKHNRNGLAGLIGHFIIIGFFTPATLVAQASPGPTSVLPEQVRQRLFAQGQVIAAASPVAPHEPGETDWTDAALDPASGLLAVERLLDNGAAGPCLKLLDVISPGFAPGKAEYFQALYIRVMVLNRMEETDAALNVSGQMRQEVRALPAKQGWADLAEAKIRHAQLQFHTTYRLAGKALEFARQNGDKKLEAQALSMIGRVSRDIYMTMPQRSAPYHEQALAIARQMRDTAFVIGELTTLSLNLLDQPETDKVLRPLDEAIAWLGPGSSLRSRFTIIRQIAFVLHQYGDPARALVMYEEAIRLAKQLGMRSTIQNLYEQMSGIRMQQGAYGQAQACLDSAARYSTWKRELGYFYRSFADVALARGKQDSAVFYYQKAFDEQVKGYTNRNTLQLAEWETEFRTRETERQLEDQRNYRRWLITLVAFISLLLLGSGIGWYLQYRNRREITRQKALIEAQAGELQQLDELKNRLFANISHELRTPVTLMLGPLEQLARSNHLSPQQSAMIRMAENNGRHMLELIQQILDLGKLESGKMTVEESPVVLAGFLRDCTASFADHAQNLGIRLEWRNTIHPDLAVWMDARKVETILKNLLTNAFKYTATGGMVTVTATDSQEHLCIEVSDTGRGIAPADLPRIFDRYFQSAGKNAPAEGGAGLGLAICQEMSKLIGGQLLAESELGKGSTFRFEWPRRLATATELAYTGQAEVFSAPKEMPGASADTEAEKPVVLVVEDNADMRAFLRTTLEADYQVVEAIHGRQALDLLPELVHRHAWQHHGGLILTDLMMPVLDGFALIGQLKSEERYANIPVLVLTARAGAENELQHLQIGIDDYLLKPFQQEELLARIQFLMEAEQVRRVSASQLAQANPLDAASEAVPAPLSTLTDREWLGQLEAAALKHLVEHDFNLETLSDSLAMSSRTLQRRLKTLTGLTATQYLQELRFRQARLLLETAQVDSVKALSSAIGMRDAKYFSQGFKKRFGKSPSAYLS